MSRNFRWISVVAILGILAVGSAQAWPVVPGPTLVASRDGFFEEAWKWLTALFRRPEPKPISRTNPAFQEKEGCSADPYGQPCS
jgi:hypothetical protein